MASTATTRNRLEKQGAGENNNTWGAPKLNTLIDLVDSALDGVVTISASGATTLTSTNYAADQARMRVINVTATSAVTITIPSVEKWYIVRSVSAAVTVTTGGLTTATISAGALGIVVCDGAAVYKVQSSDFGGVSEFTVANSITSVAIATGSKAFTIETGKLFQVGQSATIASKANPLNQMGGIITAHNSTTGTLTVMVQGYTGSGTLADWTISLAPAAVALTNFTDYASFTAALEAKAIAFGIAL